MLAHTSEFKEELFKFGRQYKNKIGIYANDVLSTENGNLIITEDGNNIIARVSDSTIDYEIDDINIFSIKLITKGELLSTLMKELDFESDLNLEIGKVFNYKFGIKIEDEYEYLDYGKYIIYKKEYQNDTKTYLYTCYDLMLKSMIKIGDEFEFDSTPTGLQILTKICNNVGFSFNSSLVEQDNITPTPLGMIKSLNYPINISIIKESDITYRDLLNTLCQYFGVSIFMSDKELKIKLLGNIVNQDGNWIVDNENIVPVDTIDETPFKDKNVAFKEKYGRINALNINGVDGAKTAYIQDNQSVSDDGITLFEIKNNILLNDSSFWETYSQNIVQNVFDLINGVSFNLCDFSSYGIMYLEWLDYYTVNIDNNIYKGLLLNSEITIKSGINEDIYTDLPEKNVSEYTTSNKTTDVIADTVRAKGNAYANGERLIQEGEFNEKIKTLNEFSTEEKVIGKWIDGKPLYQKTFSKISNTSSSYTSLITLSTELPNANKIWIDEGNSYMYVAAQYMPVNWYNNSSDYIRTWVHKNSDAVYTKGVNLSNVEFVITLKYTKATD